MPSVNILHLTYRRKPFCKLVYLILSKCKFKDFHITLCSVGFDRPECEELCEYAKSLGLSASVFEAPNGVHDNYMVKLMHAVNLPYKYTVKIDDDIFLGPQAWDYLFSNLHLLENNENILLSATLSSGIPTCDDFVEHNFSHQDMKYAKALFGKSNIPDLWGSNFTQINQILKLQGYNTDIFYNTIRDVQSPFKGMHPARVNFPSVDFINKTIIKNIDRFLEDKDFFIKEMTRPYFCNSFFAIKNDVYKRVITDKALYADGFDEVPMNRYRDKTGKKFLYIPNAFGIHIAYTTLVETGMNPKFVVNYEFEVFYTLEKEITKRLT